MVSVSLPLAPTLSTPGCPAIVTAGANVSCTPQASGTITKWSWSAGGGTPGTGSGTTFTTRFASAGSAAVYLEVCNRTACTSKTTDLSVRKSADLNSDGVVSDPDVDLLKAAYGKTGPGHREDLNDDGKVDVIDLSILLSRYGTAG